MCLQALRKQEDAEARVNELNKELLRWDQDDGKHATRCEQLQHELSSITKANAGLVQKLQMLHAEDQKHVGATQVRSMTGKMASWD